MTVLDSLPGSIGADMRADIPPTAPGGNPVGGVQLAWLDLEGNAKDHVRSW